MLRKMSSRDTYHLVGSVDVVDRADRHARANPSATAVPRWADGDGGEESLMDDDAHLPT